MEEAARAEALATLVVAMETVVVQTTAAVRAAAVAEEHIPITPMMKNRVAVHCLEQAAAEEAVAEPLALLRI